jgi:hypothetical protein
VSGADHSTRFVVEHRTDRRTAVAVIGLAALGGLVALIALWPGHDGSTSAPEATAPATSTLVTPATSAVVTPVTSAPLTRLTVSGSGPALGVDTGIVIYVTSVASNGTAALWRIDIDAARVEALEPVDESRGLLVVGNTLLAGSAVLNAAGSRGDAPNPVASRSDLVGVSADRLWRADGRTTLADGIIVTRVDGQGHVDGTIQLPPGAQPVGVLDEGVVVNAFGRLAVIDTAGATRLVGVGTIVDARGASIVWTGCDSTLRCGVWAGDIVQPERWLLSTGDVVFSHGGSGASWASGTLIDPTGHWLFDASSALVGARIRDLHTGAVHEIEWPVQPVAGAWSPDGRYVVLRGVTADVPLRVVESATGAVADLSFSPSVLAQINLVAVLSTK